MVIPSLQLHDRFAKLMIMLFIELLDGKSQPIRFLIVNTKTVCGIFPYQFMYKLIIALANEGQHPLAILLGDRKGTAVTADFKWIDLA